MERGLEAALPEPSIEVHMKLFVLAGAHSFLGSYSDSQAKVFNLMHFHIRPFLNDSFTAHYGAFSGAYSYLIFLSLVGTSHSIGVLLGSLSVAYLTPRFSRRNIAFGIRPVVTIVAAGFQIVSVLTDAFELFVIGHLLAGVAFAFKTTFLAYVAECASYKDRDTAVLSVGNLSTLLGNYTAMILCSPPVLGQRKLWWWFILVPPGIALVQMWFASRFVPESPKHLFLQRERLSEGAHDRENKTSHERHQLIRRRRRLSRQSKSALRYYYGHQVQCDAIFCSFLEESRHERSDSEVTVGIGTALRQTELRRPLMLCLLATMGSAVGLNAVRSQYDSRMLTDFGIGQNNNMAALLMVQTVNLPTNIYSTLIIEKTRIRSLLLFAEATNLMQTFILMVASFTVDMFGTDSMTAYMCWMALVFGTMSIQTGLWVLPNFLSDELCPPPIKTLTRKSNMLLHNITSVLMIASFPILDQLLGGWYYVALLLLSTVLMVILMLKVPEVGKGYEHV